MTLDGNILKEMQICFKPSNNGFMEVTIMGNRIKRDSIFIEAKALTDSSVCITGELIGNYKDDSGRWIFVDSKGRRWQNLTSHLRNENYFEIINQYSMGDIIDYLFRRNLSYQTVMTEILVDAIRTTFEETRVVCIEDIYRYIVKNII